MMVSTNTKNILLVLLAAVASSPSTAFVFNKPSMNHAKTPPSSTTQLNAVTADDMETARTAFYIWFFGASGGAGIARSAFPRMYNNVQTIQKLKGVGPTQGGETLGISPLCGYPEDLKRKDVEKIVKSKMTVEQIVQKYPIEGNFLSKQGYLTYAAYSQAMKNENPLAVRAIFDTFNTNTDVSNPNTAQEKINAYKEDIDLIKTELFKAKLAGYSSIALLLFLLALADYEAFAVHAFTGWFPDWPGFQNMPASLFDPETGLGAIPKYWVNDVAAHFQ